MSLPRKSALCQSAELHISIIIIFTSSAHYTRDPRRMLLKQRLNLQTGTTVLRDRKPVCSSSDSHGKPVPKKGGWRGAFWDIPGWHGKWSHLGKFPSGHNGHTCSLHSGGVLELSPR